MRLHALAIAALTLAACGAPSPPPHHASAAAPAPAPTSTPAPAIRTPPVPADPSSWRMERVADGVYVWLGPPGVTPLVSGNSVVIVGDDGVLMVDSGQLPSIARRELAEIEKLTPLPVRYVVTTHWHPDHWMGNGEVKAAFPDVALIATPTTIEMVQSKAMPFVTEKYARDTAAAVRKVLATGKASDGTPMTAIARAYIAVAIAQLDEYGDELAGATPTPPSTTFDDALVLHLGAREVDVRFLGRGNTGGDAVVWVPDAKVLAAGDLIVSPYPYGIGSYIGEWIDTLGKLEAFGATTIVPGHGAIEHDLTYLHTLEDLLRTLQAQVGDAYARGLSLDDTRAAVDLDSFATRMCGDDPWCRFGFDRVFVRPAVQRAYRELKEGALHDED